MPVFECNFCDIRPILVLLKAIPYKSLKHQKGERNMHAEPAEPIYIFLRLKTIVSHVYLLN